jgi:hypothetical protein
LLEFSHDIILIFYVLILNINHSTKYPDKSFEMPTISHPFI